MFKTYESARAYFYRLGLVVIGSLAFKGIISGAEAPYYAALLAAALPTGLAATNTSTR